MENQSTEGQSVIAYCKETSEVQSPLFAKLAESDGINVLCFVDDDGFEDITGLGDYNFVIPNTEDNREILTNIKHHRNAITRLEKELEIAELGVHS